MRGPLPSARAYRSIKTGRAEWTLVNRGGQEPDSLAPGFAGVHPVGLVDLEEGEGERKPGQFLSRKS